MSLRKISDAKQFRHYGPMAQGFFAAFGDNRVLRLQLGWTMKTAMAVTVRARRIFRAIGLTGALWLVFPAAAQLEPVNPVVVDATNRVLGPIVGLQLLNS